MADRTAHTAASPNLPGGRRLACRLIASTAPLHTRPGTRNIRISRRKSRPELPFTKETRFRLDRPQRLGRAIIYYEDVTTNASRVFEVTWTGTHTASGTAERVEERTKFSGDNPFLPTSTAYLLMTTVAGARDNRKSRSVRHVKSPRKPCSRIGRPRGARFGLLKFLDNSVRGG